MNTKSAKNRPEEICRFIDTKKSKTLFHVKITFLVIFLNKLYMSWSPYPFTFDFFTFRQRVPFIPKLIVTKLFTI